ncbi:unnamed protein product [Rotaria sp. Silwood1]|nr:unnamed protein product [Rotaria sp. Silwood1]CAF0754441.1 unnamed protein product [Rotaria sp. Silwood1]CAF3358310.1 unnamed protein product [Rotaria sp. Silwood1]CAF3359590.1 unnamed protein product [Rotaria sp. Silwood1]CAF4554319.1 unnamed protein product [Rotaria sp. Silwood1]
MNNNYFSPSSNEYSSSYNYPFEYSLPYASTSVYLPLLQLHCPVHSSHTFYTPPASTSMNVSPHSYTYYQQEPPQVYSSCIQQQTIIHSDVDHTPLRRHKCFKKHELQILHQTFIHDSHPSTDALEQLASQLKVPMEKVRQWFKNRRHSEKQKKRTSLPARTSTDT